MATLTIPPAVRSTLNEIAARTGRPADDLAADVLARGLADWRDYLEALDIARASDPAERVSHEELMARYGLAD